MSLSDLTDDIIEFVYGACEATKHSLFLSSLDYISRFHQEDIDGRYMSIIKSIDIDPSVKNIVFHNELKKDLKYIIERHNLTLTEDEDYLSLALLNQLAKLLIDLQNLDDYGLVLNILSTPDSNEEKFTEITEKFSKIDFIDCVTCVLGVSDTFFKRLTEHAMKRLAAKSERLDNNEADIELRKKHNLNLRIFMEFIGDHRILAKDLFEKGFTEPLALGEIMSLAGVSVIDYIRDINGVTADKCIEILGLLIMGIDSQPNPIAYLDDNFALFGIEENDYRPYINTMKRIHTDYLTYLSNYNKEKLNNGNDH